MSGIYIHIPFCTSKCHYCNFVSIASQKLQAPYVKALIKEIHQQKQFFSTKTPIESIYLGGGTPSLLTKDQLDRIFDNLIKTFPISNNAEITLEMNPDNASPKFLKELKTIGINRLSIGTQSFHDEELQYLGRKHNAQTGIQSVRFARDEGFNNISIDFIYGLPQPYAKDPAYNIEQALLLQVEHISAYSLTMETNTILSHMVSKGKLLPPDEEIATEQFRFYMNSLRNKGYEHYEISNYAKPGFRSRHNSSYWQNKSYLGLGAGAHSYDLSNRFWNTSIISEYISAIENGTLKKTIDYLTTNEHYNDYILTSIRTIEGSNIEYIAIQFGDTYFAHFRKNILPFINKCYVECSGSSYKLTDEGKLWADSISENLMV